MALPHPATARRIGIIARAAAVLGAAGLASGLPAAAGEPAGREAVEQLAPLLEKYCFACHGADDPEASLNLAGLAEQTGARRAAILHRVQKRLAAGEMPPADEAQPTNDERGQLISLARAAVAAQLEASPDPGPLVPRRLNVREHMNMLRDLALEEDRGRPRRASYEPKPDGTIPNANDVPEHPCGFVAQILPPDTQDGGFDTIAENLSLPPFLVERYLRCNQRLLDELLAVNARKPESYQAPLYRSLKRLENGPLPRGKSEDEALAEFLAQFATRSFRRPVSVEEVEKYAALHRRSRGEGKDFQSSIRLSLEAILLSPRFVVLWSDSPADQQQTAEQLRVRALDDYELAARLSIFLWSSLPDRELWQLAQQQRLHQPEVLQQQVERMLRDRRLSDGLAAGFLGQWLQVDALDRNVPDAEQFPQYVRGNLAELMKRELLLFADAIVVEDRSVVEFIDADWAILCQPLAEHYGIEDFPGKKPASNADPPWYRVRLADKRRGGLLTMGKVLTGTSQPARTSAVRRGKWLLETMLGAPPPPPPPDVDNVLKQEAGEGAQPLTPPQLLARHREHRSCTACHLRIDPLGLALENYDPVGRWREIDLGQPVDARGVLADGTALDGVVGLKAWLMSHREQFVRGFAEQMLAYALGRKLEFYDAPAVDKMVQAAAQDDYKFSRLVLQVAMSYPFRHCRSP